MSQYSTALLDILDRNKLIVKAFNREHCQYKFGFYFKDLSIFNIDYKDIWNETDYCNRISNAIHEHFRKENDILGQVISCNLFNFVMYCIDEQML